MIEKDLSFWNLSLHEKLLQEWRTCERKMFIRIFIIRSSSKREMTLKSPFDHQLTRIDEWMGQQFKRTNDRWSRWFVRFRPCRRSSSEFISIRRRISSPWPIVPLRMMFLSNRWTQVNLNLKRTKSLPSPNSIHSTRKVHSEGISIDSNSLCQWISSHLV